MRHVLPGSSVLGVSLLFHIIGRISEMASQRCLALIPRTCENYESLLGSDLLYGIVEFKGNGIGLSRYAQCNHMSPKKQRTFSSWWQKGTPERFSA